MQGIGRVMPFPLAGVTGPKHEANRESMSNAGAI
jgi:hypothetical protein